MRPFLQNHTSYNLLEFFLSKVTAGAGIIHDEVPSERLKREGGPMHGFQLWVNLPAAEKMTPPEYQDVPARNIPVVEQEGVRIKVIAGHLGDVKGACETRTPITYMELDVDRGATHVPTIDPDWNAFLYVFQGSFTVQGTEVGLHNCAVIRRQVTDELDTDSDSADLTAPLEIRGVQDHNGALLIAGKPIGEPIVQHGPFAMNTREEIMQAFRDYEKGTLGSIPARFTSRTDPA